VTEPIGQRTQQTGVRGPSAPIPVLRTTPMGPPAVSRLRARGRAPSLTRLGASQAPSHHRGWPWTMGERSATAGPQPPRPRPVRAAPKPLPRPPRARNEAAQAAAQAPLPSTGVDTRRAQRQQQRGLAPVASPRPTPRRAKAAPRLLDRRAPRQPQDACSHCFSGWPSPPQSLRSERQMDRPDDRNDRLWRPTRHPVRQGKAPPRRPPGRAEPP